MKKLFCLLALAFGLTAAAQSDDDAFFFKRATLLDYVSEQEWTLKSPAAVRDDGRLPEFFSVENVRAAAGGDAIAPVTMSFALNPETMAMLVMVGNDNDTWYHHIFNSGMDHIVYAYDLSEMREVSLAAVEPDGTKRWISIPNPDFGGGRATHFVVHRPMSLAEDDPLLLYLTHDQFVALTDFLGLLGEVNYINAMPYGPD